MKKNAVILIAEDDAGHFELVKRNLWLSCPENDILHFRDGQEILDFLFMRGKGAKRQKSACYLLLLDIRIPKVDGWVVLEQIKKDPELRKIPVIMLTTTNKAEEIDLCHRLGCSFYMVKPINYSDFMRAVANLGAFLSMEGMRVPLLEGQQQQVTY